VAPVLGRAEAGLVQEPAGARAHEVPGSDPAAHAPVAQRFDEVDRDSRGTRLDAGQRRGPSDDRAGPIEAPPDIRLRRVARPHAVAPKTRGGRVVVARDQLIERRDRPRGITARGRDRSARRRDGRRGRGLRGRFRGGLWRDGRHPRYRGAAGTGEHRCRRSGGRRRHGDRRHGGRPRAGEHQASPDEG
jgi:hypothetical protein